MRNFALALMLEAAFQRYRAAWRFEDTEGVRVVFEAAVFDQIKAFYGTKRV